MYIPKILEEVPTMEPAVITQNLTKRFGDLVAVDHINLEIKRGEIFGLLGPNGAGKTTTIHMLATILKPSEGTAIVGGYDIRRNPKEIRRKIGIVFQDMTIDRHLTGYENMWIHGKLYGIDGKELKERIQELLEYVGLSEWKDVEVRKYSGGMIRRLEIARSLLHHPEILFLDEPTLGLDPQTRVHVWEYIMQIKKEKGMTILLTTHYMDEAEKLCDRIAIIDYGKIIALGTPDELKSMVGEDVVYIRARPDNGNMRGFIRTLGEITENDAIKFLRPGYLSLTVKNAPEMLPKIFDIAREFDIKIIELKYSRATLDDVFLRLTGRRIRDEFGSWADFVRMRRRMHIRRRR